MEMQFTPADIARLYGGRLYVIRERGEAQATPKTPSPAVPEKEAEKPAEKPVRKAKTTAPEAQPEVKQETAPSTPALTWKLKNDSPKVIFMLPEIEFGNKQLTELLRKIVVASQVPTDDVGFGVIHHKPSAADLAAMPAPYGFLLDDSMSPFPANVAEIEGRKIWVAKKLSLMAKDDSLKADLWRMMKEFMQLLRA